VTYQIKEYKTTNPEPGILDSGFVVYTGTQKSATFPGSGSANFKIQTSFPKTFFRQQLNLTVISKVPNVSLKTTLLH